MIQVCHVAAKLFLIRAILHDHGILSSVMFLRVSVSPWWMWGFIQ